MIHWNEMESDVVPRCLLTQYQGRPWDEVLALLFALMREPQLLITQGCHESILAHLESDLHHELGGLLLGDIYTSTLKLTHGYPYMAVITDSVPSCDYVNSSTSLAMGSGLWNKASPLLEQGRVVVGWYHSHPNLGAFFSSTDRATQKAFFQRPYSIGMVIDPVRRESAIFAGPCSDYLCQDPQVIDDQQLLLL